MKGRPPAGSREARVSPKGSVRVWKGAPPKRPAGPLDAPPAPRSERETIGAAAKRHGMSYGRVWNILAAAEVFAPGTGVVGALPVEAIDRAISAHLRARPPAAGAGASRPPHVPDASGAVGCETCWSIAFLTRGRITTCRWCAGRSTW